ncbi:hypothetical protein SFC43_13645 [Bacteroides sp. CR5/BHMF/2]|nr:hypothetical protein [Bacteroides sp. CR5/BHMF/2]
MNQKKNNDNTQVWIILIARFFVPIMVVLGVTIICIKDCANTTDPIDDAWKKVEHLCNLHVTDSTGEGFRVAYVTSKAVTPARLKEIESRKPIQEAMERLQRKRPNISAEVSLKRIFTILPPSPVSMMSIRL